MAERKVVDWFTMNGKHIPIYEGESKDDAVNRSIAKSNEDVKQKQISENKKQADKASGKVVKDKDIEQTALADYFKNNGFEVDDDGNVTLYHATPNENVDSIKKNGFKGTTAPLAISVPEEIKPRTFFSSTKENVWDGDKSGGYSVLKVKIPAKYVRQAGKDRPTEAYVENNPKDNGKGIWIPSDNATSTYFDRMIIKRYKKKNGIE